MCHMTVKGWNTRSASAFTDIAVAISNNICRSKMMTKIIQSQRGFEGDMFVFVISTVSADGLAPLQG